MFGLDAVVCPLKPRFQIAEDSVDMGQPETRLLPAALNAWPMDVEFFVQRFVSLQSVGLDGAAPVNVVRNVGRHLIWPNERTEVGPPV